MLLLALGSMAASLLLEFSKKKRHSRFAGTRAPTLLTVGVCNKLEKTLGPR